jgi:predicted DsbA family dithiol-disulfide isomerase
MGEDDSRPVPVDMIGDVASPECFIGLRLVNAVVATVPGLAVDIRWRPFQIDPDIPPEGCDRGSYLEETNRSDDIGAAMERLIEIGQEFKVEFAFDKIKLQPNTFAAHRLIRYASRFGLETQIVESLFQAFFLKGQDISDRSVLIALAAKSRMDSVLVAQFLNGDDGVAALQQEIADIRGAGVRQVPRFTFAGKQTIVGLKPVEDFADALFGSIGDE